MIQRIQSIYLLSSIAFLIICFFASFGEVGGISIGMYHSVDAAGNALDAANYFVYIPLTVVIVINLLALVAYKNRSRQMMWVRLTFIADAYTHLTLPKILRVFISVLSL